MNIHKEKIGFLMTNHFRIMDPHLASTTEDRFILKLSMKGQHFFTAPHEITHLQDPIKASILSCDNVIEDADSLQWEYED